MAKILVVDDEPEIRELLALMLARLGHEALVAADAGAAMEIIERDRPAAALIDLVMPGTGGMTLIMEKLRGRRDGMGLIAMSGRFPLGADSFASFSSQFGVDCLLAKPFTLEDVGEAVKMALARSCGN